MTPPDLPRVSVTHHAVERLIERDTSFSRLDRRHVRGLINAEVREGINGNRMACRLPKFVAKYDGVELDRPRMRGSIRCVWTKDLERAYVVRRRAGVYIVLTTLVRSEEPEWIAA